MGYFEIIITIIALFTLLTLLNVREIVRGTYRLCLPLRIKECDKGENFNIWSRVEDSWLDEFEIGYDEGVWDCGLNFTILCSVHSSNPIEIKRASIKIHSNKDSLKNTDRIGRGAIQGECLQANIFLTPELVKHLLDEVRILPKPSLYLNGYIKDEHLRIVRISLSPKADCFY